MDYKKKEVGVIAELMITGNFEKDMLFIQQQYANAYILKELSSKNVSNK